MEMTSEKRDAGVVLTVTGRMDVQTAPEFETTCQELAAAGDTHVVADLSGLEYISSAGLRSILASAKQLKTAGGALKFCGLDGMVKEVFEVSGFTSMFVIADTADEAFRL